jgi:hypothetical protein
MDQLVEVRRIAARRDESAESLVDGREAHVVALPHHEVG